MRVAGKPLEQGRAQRIAVPVTFAAILICGLSACDEPSSLARSTRGVVHVKPNLDFVLRYSPSTLGGQCRGSYTVTIRELGGPAEREPSLMCWKEADGFIVTSTRMTVGIHRFPADMVDPHPAPARPEARRYLPPFH
jgi:hypothetical protein